MRILLVEDEPDAARMLAKGLREQTYAVDVAADGEAGAYQASINDYDLIILDCMLPRKDGFAVCHEIRAAGLSLPILMLTARDAVHDRIAGLRLNRATVPIGCLPRRRTEILRSLGKTRSFR